MTRIYGENIEKLIDGILEREGGYVNHRDDLGGPTNYGITLETLREYNRTIGHDSDDFSSDETTLYDLQYLPVEKARAIYRQNYITGPKFDQLATGSLLEEIVDAGVNHGPGRVVGWIQDIVGVTADGIVGKDTIRAVMKVDEVRLYFAFLARRIRYYGEITAARPRNVSFIKGWLNRVCEFVDRGPDVFVEFNSPDKVSGMVDDLEALVEKWRGDH